MKQKQYYLREREYTDRTNHIINCSSAEKWIHLLGEDLFFKLLELNPDIIQYLNEGDWKLKPSPHNLLFLKSVPKSNDSAFSYVNSFIHDSRNQYSCLYFDFLLAGYTILENYLCKDTYSLFYDIRKCYLEDLITSIHNMSIRSIIQEVYQQNDKNESPLVFSSNLRQKFWNTYPVLERSVTECVYDKANFYYEVLQRLNKDKKEIVELFFNGKDFCHISNIHFNISDKHKAGSQALCIELDNNKTIVYKPHSLLSDMIFYNLLDQFGCLSHIFFYSPKIIEKGSYGWEEYICQLSCKTDAELKRYYIRIGIILFASWLLGISDIHYENLIAHGEFPIIIDYECLLTPRVTNDKSSLAYELRNESVLSTGILPIYHWASEGKGIDLSALMGGQQENSIFKSPVIKNYGKKDMCVGYDYIDFPSGKNKALLNDRFLIPSLFEKEITIGFKTAYKSFITNKKDITGIFQEINTVICRYLVADTQKYSLLLQSSFHPSVLKDAPDRELLLNFLWNGRDFRSITDQEIVTSEINDLLHANIPYFYFLPNDTALFDSSGKRIDNYFYSKPIEQMEEKINNITDKTIEIQIRLIHLSLNAYGKEMIPENLLEIRNMIKVPEEYTKHQFLNYAQILADKLLYEAIDDGTNVSWIKPIVYDRKPGAVNISASGMYLYDGISGINLFLHLLCKISPEKCYTKMCNRLDRILFDYTDSILHNINRKESSRSGLLNGEGSLVFAYGIYYLITKNLKYLIYAKKHVPILMQNARSDKYYDLTDGISGAILSLLLIYHLSNDQIYLKMAKEIAVILQNSSVETRNGIGWESESSTVPLVGAAHGNAGIILSLAMLYDITGDTDYYYLIKHAIKYEHNSFDSTTGNWKDYRRNIDPTTASSSYSAWCHGAGGILFFRVLIENFNWKDQERDIIRKDIYRAERFLVNHLNRPDLCLCHGECGNRLILQYSKSKSPNSRHLKSKPHFSSDSYFLTKEWFNPGLMNGYSGIGLYLLLLLIWDDLII